MINEKPLIVYDLETTGANPDTCGITQIAACIVHPRRLEIIAEFNRDNIKWHSDDEVSDEAFKVTGKDKEYILKHGIEPKQAWTEFTNFVWEHNPKRSAYNSPIPAGYNIVNFDNVIVERYCQKYGPIDNKSKKGSLISRFGRFDLIEHIMWWTESNAQLPNIKLDTIRDWMGLSKEGAHNALVDVQQTAQIIIKMLRLYRELSGRVKFAGAFI